MRRTLTAAKFGRKLNRLCELADAESMVQRHEKAVADRMVEVTPGRDGMAWLSAYLPVEDALGVFNRLTEIAKSVQRAEADVQRAENDPDAAADAATDGTTGTGVAVTGARDSTRPMSSR